ncbi:MAG: RNA methyltransferase [Archangium sp.]|nr:RNA methyltransferase [Archangium sp.]
MRLVLLRPRNADNLVSIAETMARFGLRDWVVVGEAVHLETMRSVLRVHRSENPFASEVMRVRRVDSLREAVSDCSWVVGTTPREFEFRERFTPRGLAAEVLRRGDTKWALVFGAESNGMTNEDVADCHAVSFLPSSDEQPSVNLAQSVLLYAHELRGRSLTSTARADHATLERLGAAIEERLLRTGMIRHRGEDPHVIDQLLAPLIRAPLTPEQAALWLEAFRK